MEPPADPSPSAAPPKFGVVVLAAGGSSRLGRPKQLLHYLGRTLVEHAVRTAIASGAEEVVVVLGADANAIRERLRGLRVKVVVNREWQEGMGGSIRAGVSALGANVDSAVIALADQPRITPAHLRQLAAQSLGPSPIAASSYDGVVGAPSAFNRSEFPRLLSLTGDVGARSLVRGAANVAVVEFAGANVDVDTPADYQALVPSPDQEVVFDPREESTDSRAPPPPAPPSR